MAKVVVSIKNLTATVDNLIASKVAGYADMSQTEAKKKLADRINTVLLDTLSQHGEEKLFSVETAWYVWRGLYCFVNPVTDMYGAIETISEIEVEGCNFVSVVLYSALGD